VIIRDFIGYHYSSKELPLGTIITSSESYPFQGPVETIYARIAQEYLPLEVPFPEQRGFAYLEQRPLAHSSLYYYKVSAPYAIVGAVDHSMMFVAGIIRIEHKPLSPAFFQALEQHARAYFKPEPGEHGLEAIASDFRIIERL
jgi:hypothetical protein